MRCPVDNVTLLMAERHGLEVSYCPECNGIWLDRGKLDKIIERSAGSADVYSGEHSHHKGKKGRGSAMGDIFGGFGGD